MQSWKHVWPSQWTLNAMKTIIKCPLHRVRISRPDQRSRVPDSTASKPSVTVTCRLENPTVTEGEVNLTMVNRKKSGLCKPDEWTAQQDLTDPHDRHLKTMQEHEREKNKTKKKNWSPERNSAASRPDTVFSTDVNMHRAHRRCDPVPPKATN